MLYNLFPIIVVGHNIISDQNDFFQNCSKTYNHINCILFIHAPLKKNHTFFWWLGSLYASHGVPAGDNPVAWARQPGRPNTRAVASWVSACIRRGG